MALTAESGPYVAYGATYSSTGDGNTARDMEYNPQRGMSLFDLGVALMDPRTAYSYAPGSGVTYPTMGIPLDQPQIDDTPTGVSSNMFSISSNTAPSAGSAVTLLTSKAGVTATTITAPENGTTTGTLLCIGSTAAILGFGQDKTISLWNPAAAYGRALVISPSSNLDGGSFTVYGRDAYGYELTETFAAGSTTITGVKAFKYVSSVVAATTITSTGIGIGVTDRFGMPLYVDRTGANIAISVSSGAGGGNSCVSIALTTANFLFGSTAATQTSTTPDVRGLYISSIATTSAVRLQVFVRPDIVKLAAITSTNVSPLFGGTQYSSV
jgi:hypothetical protein